ncbi:hypothetical protein FQN50_000621 [Emmonsiellopsis sp. PD_5]|nr:hypothetical protein FQN50_000621 [Emmonsiellopsis sp. PD_5]
MAQFPDLPPELILSIAENLATKDLNYLLRACRHSARLLTPLLYDRLFANNIPDDDNEDPPDAIEYKDYSKISSCIVYWDSEFVTSYLLNLSEKDANRTIGPSPFGEPPYRNLLHAAIGTTNVKVVDILLQRGARFESNSLCPLTPTPLAWAAICGSVPILRLLLNAGADPLYLYGDDHGYAILYGAAENDDTEIMDLAIESVKSAGAHVDLNGLQGHVLLCGASGSCGYPSMVKYLLELGVNPIGDGDKWCPLKHAFRDEVCKILIEAIEGKFDGEEASRWKAVGLIYAVEATDPEKMQLFLDSGADPLAVCEGKMALDLALGSGVVEAATVILDTCPELQSCSQAQECFEKYMELNRTIALQGIIEVITMGKLSLDLSFQPSRAPRQTIVHHLLSLGTLRSRTIHVSDLKTLVDMGADVSKPDANGSTPLHLAVDFDDKIDPDDFRMTDVILEAASSSKLLDLVNAVDGQGDTALHTVPITPYLIKSLVKHGANIEARNASGKTPLCLAARYGAGAEIIALYLSFGADRRAVDSGGMPPAHHSALYNRGLGIWDQFIDGKGRWHENCKLCGDAGLVAGVH